MIKCFHIMEQLLRYWEDSWFLYATVKKIDALCRKNGLVLEFGGSEDRVQGFNFPTLESWPMFRQYLAGAKNIPGAASYFMDQRFIANEKRLSYLICLNGIAKNLFGWCLGSKRIFAVERDLQLLLSATSVGSLTWANVKLPFPCFGILLSEPILYKGLKHDFIIVRQTAEIYPDGKYTSVIEFAVVPQGVGTYVPLSPADHQRFDWMLKCQKIGQANNFYNECNVRVSSTPIFHFVVRNLYVSPILAEVKPEECTRTDVVDGTTDGSECALLTKVLRTVAGLCLYLQTLPNETPFVSAQSSEPIQSPRGPAVSSDQEFLLVTSKHKLSADDCNVLRDNNNEVCNGESRQTGPLFKPHYRRGYWHRPLGKGSDPVCLKTEWTRPTIVRKDLGMPPEGSETVIS